MIKLEKTPVFLLSQLGWTKDNVDAMVTAPDDSTLVVQIGVDFAPSLVYALLGSVVGSVVDSKVAMEHEADGDMGNGWLKTNSAGSGAYIIKSWTPNESVVLEANPNYRGGAAEPQARRHPAHSGSLRAASGAREGRRRYRPEPDARPDRRDRRQRRHQGHGDPAGAALLHRPQREA